MAKKDKLPASVEAYQGALNKTFIEFMKERENRIHRGEMGASDYDLAASYRMDRFKTEIAEKIRFHGEAEASDPFARARAALHYRTGLADMSDYRGEKHVEYTEMPSISPGHTVSVPQTSFRNRSVPVL